MHLRNIINQSLTQHAPSTPLETLHAVFGYEQFRGHQQRVIERLIAGQDALVLMPTGGGKSLCYQIPALLMKGVAVVISPLIALMQDQVNALHQLGVRAAFLNSSLAYDDARAVEQRLVNGELDLLYIAPERLIGERMRALLARVEIALFAIDEAHCVSQWGHDFRIDYLKLSLLHEQFPDVPRIALTATADARTRQEIIKRLALESAQVFVSSFDRPNIRYRIVHKQNPRQQLYDFITAEHPGDSGIVYCLSRKKVEATASWLYTKGLPALPYHAGMENSLRQQHQHRFLMEEGVIIVATIAFGMGIDKPNVRFVAHLDLPKSVESYYQETGRAGRDELPANAWMTYGLQDVVTLRQMLSGSAADERHKRVEYHKLDAMLALCESVTCRRQALLSYFGEQLEKGCGNCDTCLEPVDTWDGTLAAQQALSCIYRTGQRFGSTYLINVLLGKADERISRFGHDKQPTFGIGRQLDEKQWRSVFRQLVAKGHVEIDLDGHGAFRLSESCRPVLRGEQALILRRDSSVKEKAGSRKEKNHLPDQTDRLLWNALRARRREIAEQQDIPPYMIFHDATLMEMLAQKPRNAEQLARISGVGARKLELYGDAFLAVIGAFQGEPGEPARDTVRESLALLKQGHSVEQIACRRDLKIDTIYSHLADALERGEIELDAVIELPPAEISQVEEALLALPEERRTALKPVYEQLEGKFSYGVLRCIRAHLQRL